MQQPSFIHMKYIIACWMYGGSFFGGSIKCTEMCAPARSLSLPASLFDSVCSVLFFSHSAADLIVCPLLI